jgi:ATP-binding cassette, subfamily B, bacterial CvaB/MchF/RaxB
MNPILQTESSECGLTCLAMIADHYGHQVDLSDLRRRFSISLKGATLAQLMRHASSMHLSTRPIRLEIEELPQLQLPCILHWNLNHFVVLKKVHTSWRGKVTLILLDPALGERRVSLAEASENFTGVACELAPATGFKAKDERKRISLKELTGHIVGLRRAVAQVIALAFALEIFVIVAPLFNQFVIDEVIVSGDTELLTVLVIGFGMLMVTQMAISLARSWFLMRWSMDVSFQWTGRVFAHMTRLPVSFFEKRHLGDVVSRFGSINAIQRTLTTVFVESALDGVMALFALGMMLLYSLKLTALVVGVVLGYLLLRWLSYQPFQEASKGHITLSARENSHFMETIRAISPLKLFGREEERRARWLNLKMQVQNRDVATQKMTILFRLCSSTLSAAQSLSLFYIGAGLVMQNSLSVGMLMAFSSYAGTFSGRVFSLVDVFISVRMLGMHTERLADIVLEEAEPDNTIETDLTRIQPTITLRNIKFRYAAGEPWVLNGVNLTIPAGQSIALIGPSGCGKTTLCKILLGLLKPTEGDIYIDNIPVKQLGMRAYRQLVGTVMQDDVLMTGSILDNISFFDSQVNEDRVIECAKLAAIHDEIAAMPMAYQSLVGDMGSSLSGGQKQRVLLARALYKQPKILALDEATSHLDVNNEKKVNQALASLNLTRIMVAHRPETINAAERVVTMKDGKLTEIRSAPIPEPSNENTPEVKEPLALIA